MVEFFFSGVAQNGVANGVAPVSLETPSYPSAELVGDINAYEQRFKEERKKKDKKYPEREVVRKYECQASIPMHSTTIKGVKCVQIHPVHTCVVNMIYFRGTYHM